MVSFDRLPTEGIPHASPRASAAPPRNARFTQRVSYPREAVAAGVVASVKNAPAAVPRDRLVRRAGTGVPQNVVERPGGEVRAWIDGSAANSVCEALDGGDTAGANLDLLGAADRDVIDRLDAPEEIGRELEHTFDPQHVRHQVVGRIPHPQRRRQDPER